MNSKDEHVESDIFDVPNSDDSQTFALDSDQFKSSSFFNNSCDNYLRVSIGEPLSRALAYVIIYRPEDPTEFIANFLIDWSRKKTRQNLIDEEANNLLTSIEKYREESFLKEQQKIGAKRLLLKRQEKQQQEIIFEYDKHLFTSYQWDFHINPRTDDEREPSTSYFEDQKQQTHRSFHRTNAHHYIHTHETASGFDDEMKSNQENNRSHICHDGNLSSFTYFSKLKDKMIKCDES